MYSAAITNTLSRSDLLYVFISSFFVSVLVITNLIGTKLFLFLGETIPQGIVGTGLVLSSGIITYPFTFLLSDIVSELWGKKRANYMVFYGFFISLIALLIVSIAKILPPADAWQIGEKYSSFFHPDYYHYRADTQVPPSVNSQGAQAAFSFVFDAPGLLIFSSMLAYLSSQLLDNFLFHFWKNYTKGKYLWLRNNASTFVSQLVDTCIVNSIFLYFYWELPYFESSVDKPVTIAQIIITTYCCKLLIAALDTPIIYGVIYFSKKFLQIRNPKKSTPLRKVI